MGYTRADFAAEPDVDTEILGAFEIWHDLLVQWNRRINLVGPRTLEAFWQRHALDSWQLAALVPDGTQTAIDLGSGAGFPGLAVGLELRRRGAGRVTLVESAGKKANFLRTVARELGLPVVVNQGRAERMNEAKYDLVTARAFAPLSRLLEYAHPFWGQGTTALLPKGETISSELVAAEKDGWTFSSETIASRSDPNGNVLIIRNLSRTG